MASSGDDAELDLSNHSHHSMGTRRRGARGTSGNNTPAAAATASSGSSGRISTRSRSPVPPMSTRGRSPVLPAGASASTASGGTAGTRSSGRRSANKLVIDSSGDSGKEDYAPPPTKKKKRGRPPSSSSSSSNKGGGGNSSACCKNNDTDNDSENGDNELITDDDNKPKPLVLLGEKPRGLYECDYCGSDLTRTPRIRCADCPDFDLCLECFATEDHQHMAKYKRDEEKQKRADAAKLAGVEVDTEPPVVETNKIVKRGNRGGKMSKTMSRGRSSSKGNDKDNKEAEDPHALLGSYVGGVWVPFFRHTPEHGYIVADSTRYNLFPSFRGVKKVESVILDLIQGGGTSGVVDASSKENAATAVDEKAATSVLDEKDPANNEESKGQDKHPSNDAMDVDEAAAKEDKKEGAKNPPEGDKESAEKPPETEKESDVDANAEAPKNAMEVDTTVEDEEAKKESVDKGPDVAIEVNTEAGNAGITKAEKDVSKADEKKKEDTPDVTEGKSDDTKADGGDQAKNKPQRYRVIDDTKNAWTAEEDLRLLDGILTCGLGNWPDIAEHVNGGTSGEVGGDANNNSNGINIGGKTDKHCMERYLDDFMGRYGCILPPYTMVPVPEEEAAAEAKEEEDCKPAAAPATDSSDGEGDGVGVASRKRPRRSVSSSAVEEDESAPGFRKTKFRVVPTEELEEWNDLWPYPYVPPNTGVKHGGEVARDLWYQSEQYFVRKTTGASSKIDTETIRKEFMERRAQNLAGYELKVLPPRLEDQKQLLGAELAGYMPRRGDFDMEWDNNAENIISEMEFSSDDTKADKDLKLDVIRIFNAKLEEREKRKQFIIEQKLLGYRENQEKMWKMAPDERHLVQRMRLFARFHTPEEHEAFVNKIIEAKRLRKEIAKLQMYRRLGITSLADAEKYEIDKARRELHRNAWIKKEEEKRKAAEEAVRAAKENATSLGIVPPPPVPAPVSARLDGSVGAAANQSLQVWKQFKRSKDDSDLEKKSGDDSANDDLVKFIIKDKPGYELLSKREVGLCKRLRLLPQNYLDVKKALISESLAQEIWNPSSAGGQKNRSIFKVDVKQKDDIIDFVLEAGWIPTRPNTV